MASIYAVWGGAQGWLGPNYSFLAGKKGFLEEVFDNQLIYRMSDLARVIPRRREGRGGAGSAPAACGQWDHQGYGGNWRCWGVRGPSGAEGTVPPKCLNCPPSTGWSGSASSRGAGRGEVGLHGSGVPALPLV